MGLVVPRLPLAGRTPTPIMPRSTGLLSPVATAAAASLVQLRRTR